MAEALEVIIEIQAWSFRKTVLQPDGSLRVEFWSPLPCPFNYGTAVGMPSADGDGQDVIVIGGRLRPGARLSVTPRLRVVFSDQGLPDDKLVARWDGRALGLADHLGVRVFCFVYTLFKRLRYLLQGRARGVTGVRGYEML